MTLIKILTIFIFSLLTHSAYSQNDKTIVTSISYQVNFTKDEKKNYR